MKATARTLRRAQVLPWTLTALLGLLTLQAQPTCLPQDALLEPEATGSGPTVINQTGSELSDEEMAALLANSENANIVVVFLSPTPGPQGVPGPTGPAGPTAPPPDPNLPQIGPLVGEIRMWAGAFGAPPKGWLVCDGRDLSPADFPELFDVVGFRWGASGAGLFRLPDFRDRSPMGASGENTAGSPVTTVASDPTTYGGSATHTLSVPQMPTHRHDISHTHDLLIGLENGGPGLRDASGPGIRAVRRIGPADPSISGDAGGGEPHPILDPYFAITFIVYAGR